MRYQLKNGEEVRNGVLSGRTGEDCARCRGTGEDNEARACPDCAGTGERWGRMPRQPADAPWCFLEPADRDLIDGLDVCPECDGSGVGGGLDVCGECAGAGAVPFGGRHGRA